MKKDDAKIEDAVVITDAKTDVTFRSDLASESGSGLVGYQPAGTGAVATTVQSKLRETVSVKDFGAVGDGVTDDTLAIQAGLDALGDNGGELYFPSGTYIVEGNQIGTSAKTGGVTISVAMTECSDINIFYNIS